MNSMKFLVKASGLLWVTSLSSSSSFNIGVHALTSASTLYSPTNSFCPRKQQFEHRMVVSSSSSEKDTKMSLASAQSKIAKAISIGAPAYNAGDIEECTRVYQSTAQDIIQESLLPSNLQAYLESTLKTIEQDDLSPMDSAWALRRQFDTILDYQVPYRPTKSLEKYKLEPFTDSMLGTSPVVVNDNVMGGISQGGWDPSTRTFTGSTSLANNGGFASLRWRMNNIQNWSYAQGIYLKVTHSKPSQHTFRLILKDSLCERVRGANYKTVFENPNTDGGTDDDSSTILIPFTAFDQMEQMGRPLQAPPLNRGSITELGLMAIKPTVVGEFELTIRDWGLYV